MEVFTIDLGGQEEDWRTEIITFLKYPSLSSTKKIRERAIQYVLIEDELYKKSLEDDLLLKCIGPQESLKVMGEVHEGICGAHQSGRKMRWLLRRYGYYWPSILSDCIQFAKGCQDCQAHGPVQRMPASLMRSVIKPWPFRGWAMDMIGKIFPPSSKGHTYIVVATDFFTKWAEAIPMTSVSQEEIITMIKEKIIHRFGIPQHIVADRGSVFFGDRIQAVMQQFGIEMTHSTPYYAQGNGQAESTNKILKGIISRQVEDQPKIWHEALSDALWAYRTSKRTATGITPYALTYGHDAVLPMETNIRSARVAFQNGLDYGDYNQAMYMELEDLDELRLSALDHLVVQKQKVARAYNKRVKEKSFAEGDLVWQAVLPFEKKDHKYGKWSPTWEGPFQVSQILRGGTYMLHDLDGEMHKHPINGKYLKLWYPTMWEMMDANSYITKP